MTDEKKMRACADLLCSGINPCTQCKSTLGLLLANALFVMPNLLSATRFGVTEGQAKVFFETFHTARAFEVVKARAVVAEIEKALTEETSEVPEQIPEEVPNEALTASASVSTSKKKKETSSTAHEAVERSVNGQ